MKSAFLLSSEPNPFTVVSRALKQDERFVAHEAEDVTQVTDSEGRILTVFAAVDDESAWEFRDGPFMLADTGRQIDTSAMTACVIECRWEDLFVAVVTRLAARIPVPLWVLDGSGTIWLAAQLDPGRVRL